MKPEKVRFTSEDDERWVELQNPPAAFYDWFRCGKTVEVKGVTNSGHKFTKSAGLHHCGANQVKNINMINQIGSSTNSGICFEMNGDSADSNHHWAIWPNCDGRYVAATNPGGDRKGWSRIMFR
jgi:hypothetical protein